MKNKSLFYIVGFLCLMLTSATAHAAVTEVFIAKGHIIYNVEQLLSKGKKLARTHNVTGICISADADAVGETAVPGALHVGAVTPLNNGRYKFNLRADATAKPGTYVVQFRDGSLRNNKGLEPKLTVRIREVVVTAMSFLQGESDALGIRILAEPSEFVVPSYEWQNGSRNYPGAWVRGGTKQIKAQLRGPANNTYNVWADGTWGGIDVKAITFDANGAATELFAIDAFPEIVTKVNAGWQWKVSRQGVQTNINNTGHKFYVVLSTPVTTVKYQQLYELSCGWADGQVTEARVLEKVWAAFETKTVGLDGNIYRYWGSLPPSVEVDKNNYQLLFNQHDGSCGSWAMLYREVLAVQGVAVAYFPVRPIPVSGGLGSRTYPNGYIQSGPTVVTGLTVKNVTAQGGTPAIRRFRDHAIDRKTMEDETRFYDPSYGNGPYSAPTESSALNKWETASIEKFGRGFEDAPNTAPENADVANDPLLQVQQGEAWRQKVPNEPIQ